MADRRWLAAAVHVEHPVTHERVLLLPGAQPDEKLAELITHPDAWEDVPEEDPEPEKPRRKPTAKAETS